MNTSIQESNKINLDNIKVKPQYLAQRCPVCNGWGTVSSRAIRCQSCDGVGYIKIPVEETR